MRLQVIRGRGKNASSAYGGANLVEVMKHGTEYGISAGFVEEKLSWQREGQVRRGAVRRKDGWLASKPVSHRARLGECRCMLYTQAIGSTVDYDISI